jgi:hypothetical protein
MDAGLVFDQAVMADEAHVMIVDRDKADVQPELGSVGTFAGGIERDGAHEQHLAIVLADLVVQGAGEDFVPLLAGELRRGQFERSGEGLVHRTEGSIGPHPGDAGLDVLYSDCLRIELIIERLLPPQDSSQSDG